MERSKLFRIRGRAAVLIAVTAVTVAGCGNDGKKTAALGDKTIRSVQVVPTAGAFDDAIDAALSPDGQQIYFTAAGPQGRGVFRVPAAGGTAVDLATGAPFKGPIGIATDGQRLYVADPEATPSAGKTGAIFSLPVTGGRPALVPGTDGSAARGLEVVREGDAETLYFTGQDPADRTAGVFKIPAAGASAPTRVSKVSDLASPDAVTVTKAGVVYVTDRGKADSAGGVFRVTPTTTTKLADVRAPVLAGVALTLDESLLLVSALSPESSDQVLMIDLHSTQTGVFSRVIGENRAGAGLHRARDTNVFAWADVQRPGRIYRIEP